MSSQASLIGLTPEQRTHFTWLDASYLKAVIAALDAVDPGGSRFVGGCVRDSLLGEQPKDFDVATRLTPDEVIGALKAAQLGAAPTGLAHGTVTAIADHQGVEVTTLRSDVETDGRRAVVAFTKDWAHDANRRDFCMNAIYATPDGNLFDPVGGLADIAARRVAFIGDAELRIREDYLRILRFFRFTARFSKDFDQTGLAACARLKIGIGDLSAERIGAELMAVLALPRAGFALKAMDDTGILAQIWDTPAKLVAFDRLKLISPNVEAPVALGVLFGEAGDGIGTRLRLSNAEKAIRSKSLKGAKTIERDMSEPQARILIYQLGRDVFQDAIAVAHACDSIDRSDQERLQLIADNWMPPVLPISGRHIVGEGVKPGPEVAKTLALIEQQWIDEGFPDADRVHEILKIQISTQ